MDAFSDLLLAIAHFATYFGLALVMLIVFKFLYALITPYDEWKLIKTEQNTAAAIGFGGAIVGFAIALGGVISESVSVVDFVTWGIVALIAQVLAFGIIRFGFMPKIVERIEKGEISAAIVLAGTNIAVGLLNAASMTY